MLVQLPPLTLPYHVGSLGHMIEECIALKYKVRDLIKAGVLKFYSKDEPNVIDNPFPNHVGINMIERSSSI